ncbi:hypothetical protein ARMSODRAFT_1018744 [Armillaria solidipes]|uniref:Uncharacterized protein n=1 Tax=Armillaria solidipes TaxID=1076256 RepID=A0A2H3BK78_9AGAR|nr:hypothetical protein ARMSODRAFT_1018744 [Armillaria solidipes]
MFRFSPLYLGFLLSGVSTHCRELLINSGCSDLDRLTQLKRKGQRTPAIQQYFRNQHDDVDNADMDLAERGLKKGSWAESDVRCVGRFERDVGR